ncbi:MAG: efflux RND transporter periplasmic adaptor subunit [Alphaproteobacteria bacterium]|nr:efflux RND transporter periplasmic adaptor subunit [Alphaproteobacteria bacterium]
MHLGKWIISIGLVVAAIGAIWFASGRELPFRPVVTEPAGSGQNAAQRRPPVGAIAPVVRVAIVKSGDLPVQLDALGTAQAYNSVVVSSRVDGQLVRINFREGQDVKEGELLAQIDPRTYQALLDQAVAKRAQDQAQLDNAKRDLERYGALIQQNYASRQQYDTTKAQVAQIEASLKSDDAAIASARTQLSYTSIVAPISGRLGFRLVDAGNIVRANDTNGIVVITQLQPISVVFTLPQQRLPDVTRRMQAGDQLEVRALRSDGTVLDTGRVEFVDNQVDATTGTIKLKAVFPNAALELWPGSFVNVRLRIDTVRDALLIPSSAVQYGPEGSFAFVVGDDMTAQIRPIKVLQSDGDLTAVNGKLAAGDRVVLGGQDRLRAGSPVTLSGDGEAGPARTGTGRPPGAGPVGGGRRPPS